MNAAKKQGLFIIGIVIAMNVWGASWVSGKLAVSGLVSAKVVVFWRFFLTAITAALTILFAKDTFKISKKGILIAVLGGFAICLYNLSFFSGLKMGLSGAGGVITTSLNPIFTFLLSLLLFRERFNAKEGLGLLLGLLGGCILLQVWAINADKLFDGGNLYFLFCAVLWGLVTICSQKSGSYSSFLGYFFYLYLFASVFAFIAVGSFKEVSLAFSEKTGFWLHLLFLSVLSNNFASGLFFFLSRKIGANKTSSFVFIVPSSAVFFSWLFLGEIPTWNTIVGGALAIAAVYIINSAKKQLKKV